MPLRNWRSQAEVDVDFKSGGCTIHGLLGRSKLNTKAAVILCHGVTNTLFDCPLINEMTQALLESGFTTLRFDFFGSGQSPGTMSDKRISILAQNLSDAIAYLVGIGYENIGLFGRSVGGTVVLLCGTDPHIKAIVVASAVTNTDSFIDEYKVLKQRELELEKRGEKLPGTGAYKGKFELSEGWFAEMGSIKGKLQTIMPQLKNILILATTPDQKVGLDNATALVNVARDPKFIRIFEKTDHGYEGAEKEAVSLSTDWFKKYVPVG